MKRDVGRRKQVAENEGWMFWPKKVLLGVKGMSCGHCEKTVEDGLSEIEGVSGVKANHERDQVTVRYRGECPSVDDIREKVADLGYVAEGGWDE